MSMFHRDDWTLFRSLNTLGQKAGVQVEKLSALVAKELVDNALDASGGFDFGHIDGNGFFVENDGEGIQGGNEYIANLFSVSRPLTSSKLLRLPTRGMLGNGLRVVAGAVLASGGELVVKTRGRALRLRPRDSDGGTDVEHLGKWRGHGTRIEVVLGNSLPVNGDAYGWVYHAQELSLQEGKSYQGKTSAWWYDSDGFYELFQAAGNRKVRELVSDFAGCSGAKAGSVTTDLKGRPCESLTRDEAETLLSAMRGVSVKVKPVRLGSIGQELRPEAGYARHCGSFKIAAGRGSLAAHVPYVVEAWAEMDESPSIVVSINRTPITAETQISRCMKDKGQYGLLGCGLSSEHKNTALPIKVAKGREYALLVNVICPYMPITTDGKSPDLSHIATGLQPTIAKAIRCAKRRQPSGKVRTSQASVITENIPAAIAKASGNGRFRYSLRQLFYAVRPCVLEALGTEPDYGYFSQLVGSYESENGCDLPGMYRDDRGTLYHPHTGEQIPLGTRAVETYQRPSWTFNKILYCEKEGFFPILVDAQWPERHDCALLTSKGYASRAARDVLDLLGDSDEPLTFYCLHDADGPGTMIYQTLQEGTKARPGRRVEIVNLGLEPDEAIKMQLPVEQLGHKGDRAVPVANYVDADYKLWLQSNRVELNAMDTPTFLEWLDGKMTKATGKLIPPFPILKGYLTDISADLIRRSVINKAIRDARVDEKTEALITKLQPAINKAGRKLCKEVSTKLSSNPAQQWTVPVEAVAKELADSIGKKDKP